MFFHSDEQAYVNAFTVSGAWTWIETSRNVRDGIANPVPLGSITGVALIRRQIINKAVAIDRHFLIRIYRIKNETRIGGEACPAHAG